MGRSLGTTTRAATTVHAIKLVELKTTSLDGAGLIADETEQNARVSPIITTKWLFTVAVPHRVMEKLKAQPPQEKNMRRGDTRNLSTVQPSVSSAGARKWSSHSAVVDRLRQVAGSDLAERLDHDVALFTYPRADVRVLHERR